MKKIIIILGLAVFLLVTSCTTTNSCNGGGWYSKDRIHGKKYK